MRTKNFTDRIDELFWRANEWYCNKKLTAITLKPIASDYPVLMTIFGNIVESLTQ